MQPTALVLRIYFFVVLCLTLWVGYWGFFHPEQIQTALPWPVPPLHARFIGAIYLGATTFLALSILRPARLAVRTVARIAMWWTGWLLGVTFLHWGTFDFARTQVWFWVLAYIAFPIVAAWVSWATRAEPVPLGVGIREPWITATLRALGAVLVVLGLGFFGLPEQVSALWPWKISPFLAQIYSGPLIGLGVGMWALGARRNWPETLYPMAGLLVASALSIMGSLRHLALFTPGSLSLYVWFGTLALLALFSSYLVLRAAGAARQ